MKIINSLRRIGLLMMNIGDTAIYSNNGCMAVTLLHLSETYIIDIKGQDKCGYNSVILGTGDFKNVSKPQLEYLKKKGINNKCKLYESRLNDLSGIECGTNVGINHFVVGQYLDITGYSIGKGFAGVMKRHNFSGLRASHGVSIAHRSQGSTGQCQDPGRVFKGKKKIPYKNPIELPESLSVNFFVYKLRSPMGLAAGFDKNAEVIRPMLSFGFGFIETGTVTRNPQYGNKKTRVFRLIKDQGVINRLGFNSKGIDYFLKQIDETKLDDCIFGINIGKNSASKDQISDYVDLIKMVYGKSNYIVLNISSPNTPNLRNLHNKQELSKLLKSIRKSIDNSKSIPIILKISPDIDQQTKENIAELALEYKIDGLTVSNTTVSRDNLHSHHNESGGLSGKPLFKLSTELLGDMYKFTKGKILFIGCGGISSGADAYKKIKAGASLVQLYTALIYHGPQVVNKINLELAELIRRDGFSNISEVVGCIH